MTAPVRADGDGVAHGAEAGSGAAHGPPGRPRAAPWSDAAAGFEHLAALLKEAAQVCQKLSRTPLADPGSPRLMDVAPGRVEFMTVADVAEMLQVSPRTVRRWHRDTRLPKAILIGGVTRWRREDILCFVEEQRA